MQPPSWLNNEFLQQVLNDAVLEHHIEPAVAEGNNFLSTLYRVCVKYQGGGKTSIIIKTLPVIEPFLQFAKDVHAFRTEMLVYERLLSWGCKPPISPRYFPSGREDVVILEDLKSLDYHMANRRQRLDLPQSCSVVRTLARLHGLSVTDSSIAEQFPERQFLEVNRENEQQFIADNMNRLADNVQNWPELAHYATKIRAATTTVFDRMMQVVTPKANTFSVLNHGDCWVNNIMFHSSGSCMLVDFQLCRYASPALDLQYFIYTSVQDEVRSSHLEQLLEEYHRVLSSIIGSHKYSLEALLKDFHDKQYFGFITACSKLDLVLQDLQLARKAFNYLLPHFHQLGLL